MKLLILLGLFCHQVFAFAAIQQDEQTKIVGGREIDVKQAPFIVMMMVGKQHLCGGSIISNNFVISAAHCVEGLKAKDITIRAGSAKVGDGDLKKVSNIFRHPKYNNLNFDFDFVLLKVFGKFFYSETTRAIKLPEASDICKDGEMVRTLGWGLTHNPLESNEKLRGVELMVISTEECEKAYSLYKIKVKHNKVCAVHPDRVDGKDACQGDSGGPLQRISDGALVGVVSFGLGCAKADFAGVYAKVSSVRSWIKSVSNV